MKQKITLKINLKENNKLQITYTNTLKEEKLIQFDHNKQEEYPVTISFDNNKITVCEENESSIHFIDDLMQQPENYKMYDIEFQGKSYSVIAEVLFALIINSFAEEVEKEYDIEDVKLNIPSNNQKFISRIKISLKSIGFNAITIADNDIKYDFAEQGDILEDILERKESLAKRERMVERANQIAKKENMEEIKISQSSLSSSQEFQKALTKYSIQVRTKLKLF